ncbi:MAG: hypothetical protein V1709_10800 [Planctomycetota bacterium]
MKPYRECPSFGKCSANVCPLDPEQHLRTHIKGEDVCHAEKPTRMRIGAKYPDLLRAGGLTNREFQARKRENALTPQQRELRLQRLTKARKSLPVRGMGGMIEPSVIT